MTGKPAIEVGGASMEYNSICVIVSLPSNELPGARAFIGRIVSAAKPRGVAVMIDYISTRSEFAKSLDEICKSARRDGRLPIIHIEAHGEELPAQQVLPHAGLSTQRFSAGLHLSSGDVISWPELLGFLRPINAATANNLLVVLGTCWGFEAVLSLRSFRHAAPFWGLLAPECKLPDVTVQQTMALFYEGILRGDSPFDALVLADPIRRFLLRISEELFVNAMSNYFATKCAGRGKRERQERVLTEAVERVPLLARNSMSTLRRLLKLSLMPTDKVVEAYRRTYLMADDSRNSNRYNVDFDTIMRLAQEGRILVSDPRRVRQSALLRAPGASVRR